MTPKDKAVEILTRYRRHLPANTVTDLEAKGCALIAVDEMIEVAYWQGVKDYLKEVKQEIEKL
jgi:hypothetical protein